MVTISEQNPQNQTVSAVDSNADFAAQNHGDIFSGTKKTTKNSKKYIFFNFLRLFVQATYILDIYITSMTTFENNYFIGRYL